MTQRNKCEQPAGRGWAKLPRLPRLVPDPDRMSDQDPSLPPFTPPAVSAAPGAGSPRAAALPEGYRLEGYELRRVLASGSASITYLAADHDLGIVVAVKEYFPAALARREADGRVGPSDPRHAEAYRRGMAAFIDEARALARCDHPSLVRVLRLWEAQGTAYRVMPFRDGLSLLDVRRDMAGPPDEAALRSLLDGLLGALEAFHRTGHVHGGVHPGNILLLPDDRPLLLGPGLAARELATGPQAQDGPSPLNAPAPSFAPVEQLAAPPLSPPGVWVDVYAVAELMRFCISGELPPPAAARRLGVAPETFGAMVKRRFGHEPTVRYSPHFLRTLDAATSPRPEERPRQVFQFREWLTHGPPTFAPVPEPVPEPPAATARTPSPTPPSAPVAAARADADADPIFTPDFLERLMRANAEEAESGTPPSSAPASAASRATPPAAAGMPMFTASMPAAGGGAARSDKEPSLRIDAEPALAGAHTGGPPERPRVHAGTAPVFNDLADPAPRQTGGKQRRTAVWAATVVVMVAMIGLAAWQLLPIRGGFPGAPGGATASRSAPTTADDEAARSRREATDAALRRAEEAVSRGDPSPIPLPSEPTAAGTPPGAATQPVPSIGSDGPPAASVAPVAPPPVPASAPPVAAAQLPAAAPPTPPATVPMRRTPAVAETPRGVCGERTPFALYRCMQQQCEQPRWKSHAQCERLRTSDRVD